MLDIFFFDLFKAFATLIVLVLNQSETFQIRDFEFVNFIHPSRNDS